MAIGLEDGSASRNATLGTAGAIRPVADGDASEAESARFSVAERIGFGSLATTQAVGA